MQGSASGFSQRNLPQLNRKIYYSVRLPYGENRIMGNKYDSLTVTDSYWVRLFITYQFRRKLRKSV